MKADKEQAERLHRFSHDLRNRLIGLQQVLMQFGQQPAEEERQELIHFGEQQYFKALREVESLLDDFAVERGTATPELAPVALSPLVHKHIELMQHRFLRKRQPLELDLSDDLTVLADPRMLGDILDALLSNASKFSAQASPIVITTTADEGHAIVEIRDLGTGLSETDLEQVFARFALLSNRPTDGEAQGRSSLARVRDQALAHRGSLVAKSAGTGQGCTFTLRMPLAD